MKEDNKTLLEQAEDNDILNAIAATASNAYLKVVEEGRETTILKDNAIVSIHKGSVKTLKKLKTAFFFVPEQQEILLK